MPLPGRGEACPSRLDLTAIRAERRLALAFFWTPRAEGALDMNVLRATPCGPELMSHRADRKDADGTLRPA